MSAFWASLQSFQIGRACLRFRMIYRRRAEADSAAGPAVIGWT